MRPAARKVMLVEDEALIAIMMEDLLTDAGCEVAATFGALAPAMEWLSTQVDLPDGALLDVNLGGEMVFPLANALLDRGVPFVFATGYGVLPSDDFPDVVVLQKPVNLGLLANAIRRFGAEA